MHACNGLSTHGIYKLRPLTYNMNVCARHVCCQLTKVSNYIVSSSYMFTSFVFLYVLCLIMYVDRCSFPLMLNVKPYTQEGIQAQEALQLALNKVYIYSHRILLRESHIVTSTLVWFVGHAVVCVSTCQCIRQLEQCTIASLLLIFISRVQHIVCVRLFAHTIMVL
jgi:hypothetical protein